MKLYYTMIADLLHPIENKNKEWKYILFPILTICLYFNILTLSAVIHLFAGYNPILEFLLWLPQFHSGHTYVIIQLIPCICFVYFSIFYKQKYIYISRNYNKHGNDGNTAGGKLFMFYFIGTFILFFAVLQLRDYLFKINEFTM